jgi:GT2 family glycosyltransferase
MERVGLMSVVVVSYNTKALTLQCLESLCGNMPQGAEVCVVDNASTDGSACALKQFAQRSAVSVQVICAERNLGFGSANNLGAASTSGEFILHHRRRVAAKIAGIGTIRNCWCRSSWTSYKHWRVRRAT